MLNSASVAPIDCVYMSSNKLSFNHRGGRSKFGNSPNSLPVSILINSHQHKLFATIYFFVDYVYLRLKQTTQSIYSFIDLWKPELLLQY